MMFLVCFKNSDCNDRCAELIWILGVQKFALFVLGDLLGVLPDCIQRWVCVLIKLVVPKMKEAPKASQA
jgi:hypothetical protein